MNSNGPDIFEPKVKNIFEIIFRKNVISIILLVILANGYSNIPGMNELLTKIFSSHFLRFIITFILLFQIIDNLKESFGWSIAINIILYLIENHHIKHNSKEK